MVTFTLLIVFCIMLVGGYFYDNKQYLNKDFLYKCSSRHNTPRVKLMLYSSLGTHTKGFL